VALRKTVAAAILTACEVTVGAALRGRPSPELMRPNDGRPQRAAPTKLIPQPVLHTMGGHRRANDIDAPPYA